MSDTATPLPNDRTVSTSRTEGELLLRYIPRPAPAPSVGTAVRVRPGWFGAGRVGVVSDIDNQYVTVGLNNGRSEFAYPPEALELTESLLPCPGPASVVPRPGPDTLISPTDAHRQAVVISRQADQERHAAAIAENDRDERLLGLSHTYRRELACWPD